MTSSCGSACSYGSDGSWSRSSSLQAGSVQQAQTVRWLYAHVSVATAHYMDPRVWLMAEDDGAHSSSQIGWLRRQSSTQPVCSGTRLTACVCVVGRCACVRHIVLVFGFARVMP